MKRIVLLLLFILTVTFGCDDDFINLTNKEQLSADSFWQTEQHATQAMIAAYGPLQGYNGSKWTFFEEMYIGMAFKSDDILNAPTHYGKSIADFTHGTDDITFTSIWKSYYTGIFYTNQILENVPGIEAISQETRDEIVGEAKFLRALYNFQLIVLFENIPLVMSVPANSDEFYPSQESPEKVWQQIIADLLDAELKMVDSHDGDNTGRASKYAAKALLGKVYLFMENWSAAHAKFEEVIDEGGYSLNDNYEDNFNGLGENGDEAVFEIQFTGDRSSGNDERHPINFEAAPGALGGWELFYPSDWLAAEMLNDKTESGEYSDRVYGSIFFDDPNSVMNGPGADMVDIPYADVKDDLTNPTFFKKFVYHFDLNFYSGINVALIRYADVLLMYAEALNEDNQTSDAIDYVNMVRERSNAALLGAMSKEELRTQIRHHERPVELAMEWGIRWFDLYRWNAGSTAKESIRQTLIDHNKPNAENFTEGKNEIYPIPLSEMNKNENLVQNDNF